MTVMMSHTVKPVHDEFATVVLPFNPFKDKLELMYLPVRARGEPIRAVLKYGKIPFVDTVVPFPEWRELKVEPNAIPFGRLPVLRFPIPVPTNANGKVAESGACMRFVSKLAGIYPTDPMLAASTDTVMEVARDLDKADPNVNIYSGERKEKAQAEFFDIAYPLLDKIQQMLMESELAYFTADRPLMGDFYMWFRLDQVEMLRSGTLAKYPALLKWFCLMYVSIPELQLYVHERPAGKSGKIGLPGSHIDQNNCVDYESLLKVKP